MLDGWIAREFDKHGSLKILEIKANTYRKEPSESYIDTNTIQACMHKMPLYPFRFSILFTKGHFVIEQSISQKRKRNLLGLRNLLLWHSAQFYGHRYISKTKNIYTFIYQILQLKNKTKFTLPRGWIDANFFFTPMALHIKVPCVT